MLAAYARSMSEFLKQFFSSKYTQWGVLVIGGLIVALIVYGVAAFISQQFPGILHPDLSSTSHFSSSSSAYSSSDKSAYSEITVDVSGAVNVPGVYVLPAHARVGDALKKAQGVSVKADLNFIAEKLNLAQHLVDGEKIYIPARGQPSSSDSTTTAYAVSINAASLDDLTTLPGITKKRAQTIIKNRPYASIQDFAQKCHFSNTTIKNISAFIIL